MNTDMALDDSMGPRRPDGEAMSAALARNWWAMALRGVAAIVFGVIALLLPGTVLLTLAWLFAAYLLVDGVLGIVASVRAAERQQRWRLLLAESVLDLVMGAVALVLPSVAVVAFVLLTAAWALLTGGLMLAAAFRLHVSHGRWWLGGYAIVFGIVLLVLGVRLRRQAGLA